MPYKISTKPLPLNGSLPIAEIKVHSVCHNLVTIQEILDQLKLSLNQKQIVNALDNLVLKGFVKIIDTSEIHNEKAQSLEEGSTRASQHKANKSFVELYSKLEKVLITNLLAESAESYIDELKGCSNIDRLKHKARNIAIKLELTTNSQVGKDLLALLRQNQSLY